MRHKTEQNQLLNRRRLLAAGVLGSGSLAVASPVADGAEMHGKFDLEPGVGKPRTMAGKLAESPSLADFGPVGDGVTDDWRAVQAALDWAGSKPGTRLRVPPRVYAIGRPLLIPQGIELVGEVPGDGNNALCGFRALKGFQSPHKLRVSSAKGSRDIGIAALLMSREWADGRSFARRLHLRDLFFDVDGVTDAQGGPVHGLLLANQQLDLSNLWIRSATGFGVWINTQRPDGTFMAALVDNVLRRVWVRGAGIGGATFETNAGVFQYGGFLIGALPGVRDPSGRGEPPLATDGIMDYCTVAVGPEAETGCRGNAIHITRSAGWRVTSCHVNGAGRHGIVLERAFQSEVSGCYVDGWGVVAGRDQSPVGAIWCSSIVGLDDGAEGGLIVASNRISCRPVKYMNPPGMAAIAVRAGAIPAARAAVMGNTIVKRRGALQPLAAFDFARSGRGELSAMVTGNSVTETLKVFLAPWNETAVKPKFSGNSFQFTATPPLDGWFPAGLRIDNSAPVLGGFSGWVTVRSGKPAVWVGYGRIEV